MVYVELELWAASIGRSLKARRFIIIIISGREEIWRERWRKLRSEKSKKGKRSQIESRDKCSPSFSNAKAGRTLKIPPPPKKQACTKMFDDDYS